MRSKADVSRLAGLHFETRTEDIHREHARRVAEVRQRFAGRGLSGSTALIQELFDAVVERQRQLAMAAIESVEQAHQELGRPVDNAALDDAQFEATQRIQAISRCVFGEVLQLPETLRLGPVVGNDLNVRLDERARKVDREVSRAIDIKRLKIGAEAPLQAELEWDVFISHASEDKAEFVTPLSHELQRLGLRVWIDSAELFLGDDIRRVIDLGLSRSRYGVVVLSPSFLGKQWPEAELSALFAREMRGAKVVLPVLHKLTHEDLLTYGPLVAAKLCASSRDGVEAVAAQIAKVVSSTRETR